MFRATPPILQTCRMTGAWRTMATSLAGEIYRPVLGMSSAEFRLSPNPAACRLLDAPAVATPVAHEVDSPVHSMGVHSYIRLFNPAVRR